jgi:hypothetical protein
MPSTNESRSARSAASGKIHCLAAVDSPEDNNPSFEAQAETHPERLRLPSFFELVTENCEGHLRSIIIYSEIRKLHVAAGDYDGLICSGDKLIDQARGFAAHLKSLKKPSILSHEAADRREEEALRLRERADIIEIEAAQIRAAVS